MSLENKVGGAHEYDDEIDLKELFGILRAGKNLIITITAVFTISSVLFALWIPNQYKAIAVLAPAQSEDGGLSSALGQLGGLASLAGVSIGAGETTESQIAQEIMRSWSFIEAFIAENKLEVEIYAAEGWSKRSGKLKIDDDVYDTGNQVWLLEDDETNALRPPTSWELFEQFDEMLSVSQDKQSGLVSVSIEYYSPQTAKDWLDLYITTINKHMQVRQVAKVSRNISYLEEQIAKTSIAEMREVFYTIIEEQTKNKMLAEASPDYAFVAVSPSMVPEEKSKPGRALICVLGVLLGVGLGVVIVIIRHYYARSKSTD